MLFQPPVLDAEDMRVVDEIEQLRHKLRHWLAQPRRWKGQLRRNLKARAIRGSNSIEGYDVSLDDALALMEDEEPLDADRRTSLEIVGYRNALTYIQRDWSAGYAGSAGSQGRRWASMVSASMKRTPCLMAVAR
ncbi:hypothetical protein [Actinokineospora sp.]|uniref:hypothetical protein n=1 Tax=Actinokineospora sp. TaxID=1872133 RepID=UPI003D6B17FF